MSHSNSNSEKRPENQQLLDGQNGIHGTITPKIGPSRNGPDGVGAGEKTAFLTAEPVRLTPAWEEANMPEDELNFRGLTLEQASMEMNPPIDRLNLVFLTLLLHGIGILMPWNMFITAKRYFTEHKLGAGSEYTTNFTAYVGLAAQVPSLMFNWLNIFVQIGGNLTKRIVWSITINVLVFVFTIVLAMNDTSEWSGTFFWVTMVSVVILNMANGVYQNSVFGMAAKLPFKYTGAVVLGSNISGTLTTLISITTNALTSNVQKAAIYYFITALFILLLCFDTYFALPLNRFYRYHELLNNRQLQSRKKDNHGKTKRMPYWTIFKQCFPQLLNVFLVFFVTLSIFPAIHSDIQRSDPDFFISKSYYTDITCFLTFNVFAMLGSSLSSIYAWPKPKYLVIPVVLRLMYIPLFIVFNYQPKNIIREIPVIIDNDWIYLISGMTMGLTSGYFSSVGMMYTPRMVEPQHAQTAGMFGAAALMTGIFTGVSFSALGPWIVGTPNPI